MKCRRPYPDAPNCSTYSLIDMGQDPNYENLCSSCAWTVFFRSQKWDQVDCVGCEIGRGCEHVKEEQ